MKITVWNSKGGSGKSTIASCIACALASNGASVGAIDLDTAQPNYLSFLEQYPMDGISIMPIDDFSRRNHYTIVDAFGHIATDELRNRTTAKLRNLVDHIATSDVVLVPTKPDPNTIRGTRITIDILGHYNLLDRVLLVGNEIRMNASIGRSFDLDDYQEIFKARHANTSFPSSVAFYKMLMDGWVGLRSRERKMIEEIVADIIESAVQIKNKP